MTNPINRPAMWRVALAAAAASVLAACSSSASPNSTSQPPSESAATPMPSVGSDDPATTTTPEASAVEPAWRLLAAEVEGIAAREDHTLTLAADGQTALLFGGRTADGTALGDLWSYDLAASDWRRVETGGRAPAARFGHNAEWVDGIGLVIFAGQAGTDFFNDLWAFDLESGSWRKLSSGGAVPVARYGSCAALGPDGRLWISHGFTAENRRFADTRAYDFTTGEWTDETPAGDPPVARCLHGCWWSDDGRLALYAGQTTGVLALGDLWELAIGPRQGTHAWSELSVTGEVTPRNLYAAARWGSATVIFGGQAADGSRLSDTWLLADDGTQMRLAAEGDGPAARSGADMVADAAGRVLLFGGRNGDEAMADLWELSLPLP